MNWKFWQKKKTDSNHRSRPQRGQRYYSAATTTDVTHSWTTSALSADAIIYRSLRVLRGRSREQYANNDYAKRFIGMCKSHVVGSEGFQFQARTQMRGGKLDKKANLALEAGWKAWSKPKHCDSAGRSSLAELSRLWIATVAVDGEVFVRRRLGAQYGKYQYALQFIDAERFDPTYCEVLSNGNRILHSIEYNDDDRPVAYYASDAPTAPWGSFRANRKVTRIPADEIWHGFIVERVGQKRGIPWLATPLQRMQMLDGYEEAAVIAARAGATKAMFYRQDEDADPELAGLATLKDEATGELIEELTPGMASILPPGVYPEAYDPTYPHELYADFVKTSLRGIASGLGVSYHKLAGDLSDVNFSAGRLGEAEDQELWKTLQNWCVSSWLDLMYDDWLDWQLKIATLRVTGGNGNAPLNPARYEDYLKVSFQGRRWEGIQPLVEANANTVNLKNLLTSPQRLLSEKGIDPEELIEEWVQWNDRIAAAGLQMVEVQADTEVEPEGDETKPKPGAKPDAG